MRISILPKIKIMHYKVILTVIIVTISGFAINGFGQGTDSDEAAIKNVMNKLFLAMQRGDSAMAHSTFTKDVTTATILKDKSGNVQLRQEYSVSDFMKAIGTPHKEVWYEEVW